MAAGSSLTQLIFRLSLVDNLSNPISNSLNRLTRHTDRVRSGMMGVGASIASLWAIGTTVKGVTEKAIEFESAMASVAKVVDFPSPKGFEDFGNNILKMSRTIPIAASGLAEIAAAGGEQGIQLLDLPTFVETVAKMSTAFDMGTREAGDSIGALANIYKIPISGIGNLGDAINHLSNNANSKASDIVDVMQRVGGNAVQFGLATTQTAALGSTMLSLGMPAEVAGTAINAMLMKLNTARNQGTGFQKALGGIGLSVGQLEKNISGSPQQAIDDFLGRIAKLSKHDQALTMGDLFGMEYAGKLSTLVGGLDTYKKALDNIANPLKFAGSMQNEFNTKSKTTANQLELLKNHWNEIAISLGTMFLPKIVEWVGIFNTELAKTADKFKRWHRLFPHLSAALTGTVVAIVALLAAMAGLTFLAKIVTMIAGGFGIAWAGLVFILTPLAPLLTAIRMGWVMMRMSLVAGTGVFAAIRVGLIAFTTQLWINIAAMWAWTVALLANPLTWIVVGIVALVAALVLAVVYWDEITAAVIHFTDSLTSSVDGWITAATSFGIFGVVLSYTAVLIKGIIYLWQNWHAVVNSVGNAITETAGSWLESIGVFSTVDRILSAWETLKGWWSSFKGFLAGLNPFGTIVDQVNKVISAVNSLSGLSIGSIGGVATQAPSVMGGVNAGVPSAKGGLSSTLRSAMGMGNKNTNVTLHNYGQKMSGATLVHEMSMAGG